MDKLTKKQRSQLMSKIRGKWNKLDIIIHELLNNKNINHKMYPKIIGNPDICIKDNNNKLYIFIDGCFWHKCPQHYKRPKSNQEYWIKHIEVENVNRDKLRNNLPYNWVQIWEHDLKDRNLYILWRHISDCMTRFKTEIKERPKLTHEEEVRKMFDKRMDDVNRIFRHHEDGLKVNEIALKVRLAESYIRRVIDDGFEKTRIKLIEEYRLNGAEIMTERDEHGRFVKKPKVEENVKVEQDEPKAGNPETEIVTSGKKTITDHIREIAKEIGAFKPADMAKAFAKRGLSYKKEVLATYLSALNIDASETTKKQKASIYKLAFLKKDAGGKYTIV